MGNIYLFWTRNDLDIKLFHILSLTVLDIYLSFVATIVLFVRIFESGMIAHGLLMVFDYWYIFKIIKEKMTSSCKNSFTWPFHILYLLYIGNRRQSWKPLWFVWNANINNIIVKTVYFNSCLTYDLLSIIYECFIFYVFLVCVWSSVRSYPFLLQSTMFGFPAVPFKLQ